jgi:ABC-type multidrug transport system permease subunit
MRRGFLVGLGSDLALMAVWSLIHALPLAVLYGQGGELEGYLRTRVVVLVVAAVFAGMAYFIFRWAYSFETSRSWFHAVVGWLAGFLPVVVCIARDVIKFIALVIE